MEITKFKGKSISRLKKILWDLCKKLVRKTYTKNGKLHCYTCGIVFEHIQDAHTGHFVASSISGIHLRFDLRNLRPQCYRCNINCSGNFPAFYENMCKEIGQTKTDELMQERYKTIKADRWYYISKIEEYTSLLE